MTDFLLQFGISNLCISLALAIVAWAVHTTGKQPFVAYVLWLLVLAKLVTPPIVTVPVVPVPGLADHSGIEATTASMLIQDLAGSSATFDRGAEETSSPVAIAALVKHGKTGLILLWVLGSVCVFTWSVVRIYRFNRLLRMASEVAPPELQRVASEIAQRLGLTATPTIYTTSARLSPMVWWLGGRVRIVIPAALPDEMNAGQLGWMLAHELAHVRRRDHLVRWLEWLACVCFWWNPVAWWARRNLRINEEICCDALVLSSLHPEPRTYANSLMTVVEFLASPVIRPPAMASEINSGGFLERRFRMIVSNNPIPKTPRWLVAGVLLTALTLLPLGVAYAQDRDCERSKEDCERIALELREMVASGEITPEAARERYAGACGDRDDGMWRRVAGALHEGGIERLKIRDVMGAMERIAAEMNAEGEEFELDPRLREYLVSLELTDEQIELVIGLSRRIAAAKDDDDGRGGDDVRGRLVRALLENGIPREHVRAVMGLLRHIVGEIQREGDEFELDPGVHERLVGLDLTDEQIDFVVGLARRLASRRD